ncbi:hypothetical protein PFISCL1PPCAC_5653, partial [Pristionchus fissidentatus]
ATIFVADYEKQRRTQISILLSVVLVIISIIYSYGILKELSLCNCIESLNCSCESPNFQIIRILLKLNEKRHGELTNVIRRSSFDEYSLSLRVQLKENIWSLKKIEFGVVILTSGVVFNLFLFFPPVFFLSQPGDFEILQWFMCVSNFSLAL